MNLQTAHLIASIHILLRHDEGLIYFFFNHKAPELRLAADELLSEARSFSRGEFIMVQAAIDFWNGQGGLRINEAIGNLDDENLMALVHAILHQRELEFSTDAIC